MKRASVLIFAVLALLSCKKEGNPSPSSTAPATMYFPPVSENEWETVSPTQLGWNTNALADLKSYLAQKNTTSFMILVNGRIAMEEYFNGFTPGMDWQWNSAGKTLVSETIGIAQQEGLLNINDKVSKYLGQGWSSEPASKEDLITIRHLLTMTSGLNDQNELVTLSNLTYMADAGTRWSYSNVFQLLMTVVDSASHQDFQTYFDSKIKQKIGMSGYWNFGLIYKIYHSDIRSMARFGLLALNNGNWNGTQIINEDYFHESSTTSQNINPSYGYLWWLNGKSMYMLPGGQTVYPGTLIPNAPADMYAALGAADQKIYVIPDKKMVIVRMGNASDPLNPSFASSGFDNELWSKINDVIN